MRKQFVHSTDCDDIEMGVRREINGSRVYVTPEGNTYPSITSILGQQPKLSIKTKSHYSE